VSEPATEVGALLLVAAERLAAAGVPDEALVRIERRRGLLGPRDRMVELGRVWRVGVLLIARDGAAYTTGRTIRADASERMGFTSNDARERQEERRAAVHDGFRPGEVLNLDWGPLDVDDDLLVRWSPGADPVPLATYLDDRVGLLVERAGVQRPDGPPA